jgi:hypothetical protein
MPLAQMWVKAAGYRQVGYKYDDIIQVESDIMQKVRSYPSFLSPS